MNGASAKVLNLRAISVFPVPVGPFINIFDGVTSARISSGNWFRRQRIRIAMAVAFFASLCDTIYLSRCATMSSGNRRHPGLVLLSGSIVAVPASATWSGA
eukprot:evm.model.NODE_4438_length_26530_cov_22.454391.1